MPTTSGPMHPDNPDDGGISTQIPTKGLKPHRQWRLQLPFKKKDKGQKAKNRKNVGRNTSKRKNRNLKNSSIYN